jgi:hypothetical protein
VTSGLPESCTPSCSLSLPGRVPLPVCHIMMVRLLCGSLAPAVADACSTPTTCADTGCGSVVSAPLALPVALTSPSRAGAGGLSPTRPSSSTSEFQLDASSSTLSTSTTSAIPPFPPLVRSILLGELPVASSCHWHAPSPSVPVTPSQAAMLATTTTSTPGRRTSPTGTGTPMCATDQLIVDAASVPGLRLEVQYSTQGQHFGWHDVPEVKRTDRYHIPMPCPGRWDLHLRFAASGAGGPWPQVVCPLDITGEACGRAVTWNCHHPCSAGSETSETQTVIQVY